METTTLMTQIGFWVFALTMVGSALAVVFHRSIVYSALSLLLTFIAIAAVFVMLNAPFIAAAEIMVYGVGLTIVLIFGIMLTGDKPLVDAPGAAPSKVRLVLPAALSLGLIGFLTWAITKPEASNATGLFTSKMQAMDPLAMGLTALPLGAQAVQADGGTSHIGQMLFGKYLIPFELASVLLLLAMIGAIVLSKRVFPEEENMAPLPAEFGEVPLSLEQQLSQTAEARGISLNTEHDEKETMGAH